MKSVFQAMFFAMLITGSAIAQDSMRDRYIATADLFMKKDYASVIKTDSEILASANVPLWIQIAATADLGAAYAYLDQTDQALDAFEKAVALGYNDYLG